MGSLENQKVCDSQGVKARKGLKEKGKILTSE